MTSPEDDPRIILPAAEFDALLEELEKPPRELPKLRELLERKSPWAEEKDLEI